MTDSHNVKLAGRIDNENAFHQRPIRIPPAGLSIVIPNWNHEKVLSRAVASALEACRLLRSKGINTELLIVDNNSRDGSHSLLRQLEFLYHADGLNVLISDHNRGPANSRNRAFQSAKYRHMLLFDADNLLVPENIPDLYQASLDTKSAFVFGFLMIENNIIDDVWTWKEIDLLSGLPINRQGFRGFVYETTGIYDRVQISDLRGIRTDGFFALTAEDVEFLYHIVANGLKVIFVPLQSGNYFNFSDSRSKSIMDYSRYFEYLERTFNLLDEPAKRRLNANNLIYHPALGYLT